MPFLAALFGAVMTGVLYWLLYGNGREVISHWLDRRNEQTRDEADAATAMRARVTEARAPLRALNDPRDVAAAAMVAVAECRGELTPEQGAIILEQMREILGLDLDLTDRLSIAIHAARRAGKPEFVLDDSVSLFRDTLSTLECEQLLDMLQAVSTVHGGPTDRQADLIRRFEGKLLGSAGTRPA